MKITLSRPKYDSQAFFTKLLSYSIYIFFSGRYKRIYIITFIYFNSGKSWAFLCCWEKKIFGIIIKISGNNAVCTSYRNKIGRPSKNAGTICLIKKHFLLLSNHSQGFIIQ